MTSVSLTSKEEVKRVREQAPKVEAPKRDIYTYVYTLMVDGLGIKQDNFSGKSDSLDDNADRQKDLINKQQDLKYIDVPTGATQEQILNTQIYNNNIDKQKAAIQNSITALKQTASVTMSQTKVSVDNMAQSGGATSAFIKALDTVAKNINDMEKQ